MRHAATLLCVLILSVGAPAKAQLVDAISTDDIVEATTTAAGDLACLNFRINGVCLYLVCTPVGCTVETSIQFRHFNPSLIVTSYNSLGESPWDESRNAFGALQVGANQGQFSILGVNPLSLAGGGKFSDDSQTREPEDSEPDRSKHMVFKDAEVIGSPGNILSIAGSLGLPVSCPPTDVFPFFPYFLSGLDAFAWRSGLTEIVFPQTFIPGLREIGNFPFNTWGSVHPRQGFLNTPEDPKAGAVMAQRAADIATREFSPHVFIPVGSVPGQPAPGLNVFEPDPVLENDPENSTWQMLVPVTETTCDVFGTNDTANIINGFSTNRVSAGGDYAFALWRPYRCCETKGALIGTIEIDS